MYYIRKKSIKSSLTPARKAPYKRLDLTKQPNNMKKFLLFSMVSFLCVTLGYAAPKTDKPEGYQVSTGEGTLLVSGIEGSKTTITITDEDGKLVISEIGSDNGKLQLLGLSNGFYDVAIKNKKGSRVIRVEVQ